MKIVVDVIITIEVTLRKKIVKLAMVKEQENTLVEIIHLKLIM